MCGKAYDPDSFFAGPTARYAVMGEMPPPERWVEFHQALEREARSFSAKTRRLRDSTRKTYEHHRSRYAAARLWVDAIIDRAHARTLIWGWKRRAESGSEGI